MFGIILKCIQVFLDYAKIISRSVLERFYSNLEISLCICNRSVRNAIKKV